MIADIAETREKVGRGARDVPAATGKANHVNMLIACARLMAHSPRKTA